MDVVPVSLPKRLPTSQVTLSTEYLSNSTSKISPEYVISRVSVSLSKYVLEYVAILSKIKSESFREIFH